MEHAEIREAKIHPELNALVEAFRQGLRENLWGMILFGSAARNEYGEGSDLDILVVADGLPERFTARMQCMRRMIPEGMKGKVSFIAKTREEFEGGFPSYYLDLGVDGIILFDRNGYIGERVERIRHLTRTAKLTRRRGEHGFIWEWKILPSGHWRVDWSGIYGL